MDQRERGEDPDMDRRVGLSARRHRPQTPGARSQPLPDSTDLERDAFRENSHFTGVSGRVLPKGFTSRRQTIDSVQLMATNYLAHTIW